MSATVTLSTLRTRAKQRADMVNSDFVTEAEWNSYINSSIKWLYDLLVKAYGNDYYCSDSTFVTVAGQQDYPFATMSTPITDFYKLLGVSMMVNSSEELPLKRFNFLSRDKHSGSYSISRHGRTLVRYRLKGSGIYLSPQPDSGISIKVYYIPHATTLENDTDTFDGINGWEELVIIDSAMKALIKEESDVSAIMAERQTHLDRINEMAEDRDSGAPDTITDTSGYFDYDPWNGGREL